MSTPATVTEPAGRPHHPNRTILLGVSLKLYLDVQRTLEWAHQVADIARRHPAVCDGTVRLFALPSLPALAGVRDALSDAPVEIGAQDLFWEDRGPYTGAVSGSDLADVGCRYVEVGHAEHRSIFRDDEVIVRHKLAAAFRNGLTPVLCLGERNRIDADAAVSECIHQLDSALGSIAHFEPPPGLVVAYEPEWAIGADSPASAEHIARVAEALRKRLHDERRLGETTVIYGGAAQPGTLSALGPAVDGLFLGRHAHDPDQFARIIDEAAALAWSA